MTRTDNIVFKITTFVLLTVFYGVYFYKQIQLRKKGIQTNRLAKGNKPKYTAIIETMLLIATYGIAVIQYASIFLSVNIFLVYFGTLTQVIGLILMALGVLFFILAVVTMQDNWRAGVDESQQTNIVTKGIYRFSRNPAFVGFDLIYIGSALTMPNVILIVIVLITIILLHLQILEEEKYLPNVFGVEYIAYKQKTPRYILFF